MSGTSLHITPLSPVQVSRLHAMHASVGATPPRLARPCESASAHVTYPRPVATSVSRERFSCEDFRPLGDSTSRRPHGTVSVRTPRHRTP